MRRRRINRNKRKKQKNIIIFTSLSLILFLTVGYAAFNTKLSITAKGNIKDKSRVIQAWSSTDQTDFHSDYYKENIVSATFLDNNDVPSNATESWNVSEDKTHGGVMAWVVPNNEDSTKYDLYIGAKDGVVANEDSSYLFYNFSGVKTIEFGEYFDTSNVTTMSSMFAFCTNIQIIDISSFDTSNVTSMVNMFQMYDNNLDAVKENKLIQIKFGDKFTTKNVSSIAQMFCGCKNLSSIDVENWDTSNVTNMSSVFAYCRSLTNLDLSSWDTSKVTNMAWMFMCCDNLKSIDLNNFNTSNVTNMRNMFTGDKSLNTLNLCSFDTRKATSMYFIFDSTISLQKITVGSNWITENVDTTNMFRNSGVSEVTTGQC